LSEKRKALITGASAGIGAEFARQLAARGYDLALVARRRERLEQLAESIKLKYGVEVDVLPADLSIDEGITQIEEFIQNCKNLEILVNNAGFGIPGGFIAADIELTLSMLWGHVVAPVRLTRAALPEMIEKGTGYIINVSSISAFSAATGSSTYSASKGYLNNFCEGLAVECYKTGVKVQALCPGFTYTEFHDTPEYKPYRIKERLPRIFWMTSEAVVRWSLNALKGNNVIIIPGLGNQLIAFAGRMGLVAFFMKILMVVTGRHFVDLD